MVVYFFYFDLNKPQEIETQIPIGNSGAWVRIWDLFKYFSNARYISWGHNAKQLYTFSCNVGFLTIFVTEC